VLCSHFREEASIIDAGAGRVLETVRGVRLSTFATYRRDGRYAYTRSPEGLVALDLVIPQEATHLRREHPELGTPDWASASQDGNLVAVAYAPGDVPNPTSSVVVYRGTELREYAVYRFHEFLPKGYVTPDGKAAYVTSLLVKSGTDARVHIQRLDLMTGRLTPLVPETPVITWMAFPADIDQAYALQEDRHVVQIDLASGEVTAVATGDTNDIVPAPEPHRLLFGGRELVVWDTEENRAVQRYPLPFEAYQVGATVNGEYLFAADGYRERVVLIHRTSGRVTEVRLHERANTEVPTSARNIQKARPPTPIVQSRFTRQSHFSKTGDPDGKDDR
jgi:hypothetical protein